MLGYHLAEWAIEAVVLFVLFTVQGAMWSAAQAENRNGWVIALIWAVACAAAFFTIHPLTRAFIQS